MYRSSIIGIFIILIFPVLIFSQVNEWVQFPIYGGEVREGAISKSDPQRLIIKTSIETYKTTDGGASWTMFDGYGMPTQNIHGMYIHPLYPDSVFIAGARSFAVSSDFCETFTIKPLPAELLTPRGLAMSYKNTKVAYIPDNYYSGDNANGTVYKTSDKGDTWSVVLDRSPARLQRVAISQERPDTVFAAYKDSLFRTEDGGQSWMNITNNYYTSGGFWPLYIFVSPYDDDLVIIANNNQSGELSISYNGGNTWVTRNLDGSKAGTADISFDPDNQTIYMSVKTRGVFESPDRGVTWNEVSTPGLATDDIWAYLVDPQNSSTRYLLTTGPGVYKTIDDGTTWLPFNVNITEVFNSAVAESPDNSNISIAGSEYAGIYRTLNGGNTWLPANNGLLDLEIHRLIWPSGDAGQSGTVFAMSRISGVYVSTNNGLNWSQFNSGATLSYYNDMIYDPVNSRIICAGSGSTSDIIYSVYDDNSSTWQNWEYFSNPPLVPKIVRYDPNTDAMYVSAQYSNSSIHKFASNNWINIGGAELSDKGIYSLDLHPTADSIYAYANDKWIYVKVPGGSAWNQAYYVSDGSIRTEIKFDPVQPHIQYLAHGYGKKSLDGGKTWHGFPWAFWSSMGINISIHDRNRIYSRTRNGLLYIQQAPELVVPAQVNVGQISMGSSTEVPVEIYNSGFGTLNTSGFSISGNHASHWMVLDNDPININYQKKDTIRIKFEPDSVLDLSANLTGSSNDPANPTFGIILSGAGGGSLLDAVSSVDFGNVFLQQPKDIPVQITNTGNESLQITATGIAGANPEMFSIASGGGANTVQPDSTYDIVVQFTPVSSNQFTAILQIQSNDSYTAVHNISLTGMGTIIPAGNISLSSSTLSFGEVAINEISDTLQLVITNTDIEFDIQVDSVIIADSAHFRILDLIPGMVPFIIDTVSHRSFDLIFSPKDIKIYNTNMKIYSNAANGELQTIALSGKGVEPPGEISISLDTLIFGSVVVDSASEIRQITISNESSTYPLTVDSLICKPSEFLFSVSEELPYELTPQGDLAVNLTFQPADSGDYTGSLTIYSNAKNNPLRIIKLHGTGYFPSEPQLVINPASISAVNGNNKTITLNINSDITINYARLIYAIGGKSMTDSIALTTSDGTQYSGIIPSSHITITGVTYYFRVSDGENVVRYPKTGVLNLPVLITNLDRSIQGNGSYQMISLPIEADDASPNAVLGDNLGTYDIYNWRLFRWIDGSNVELNDQSRNIGDLIPGRAFWLAAKSASTFNTGSGRSTDVSENLTVSLQSGWNQVGNPYAFPIDWSSVVKNGQVGNELWFYNNNTKEYEQKVSLLPWEGYFIRALSSGTSLDFQPIEGSLSKLVSKTSQKDGWKMQIMAVSGESRDRYNYIGMNTDARDEYDQSDYGEPPVIDKYISVSFPHDDWDYPGLYSSDIRKLNEDGAVWHIRAESNIDQVEVLLSFALSGDLPESHEIWLVDKALRLPVNLRDVEDYHFRFRQVENRREFDLIIGDQSFIAENLAKVQIIPGELTLYPNFPNPFNPETNIKFYLPSEQEVQLEIFNILGQKVTTLIPRQMMNKGFHSAMWDGTGVQGDNVSSGMYIYILRSGNQVKTKKLILLR